jgi:membrane protein DedA with SNARE-associated domain
MSHLIGQLRSFVALSAGMNGMWFKRFLGYELVAASVWNAAFCSLSYLLASEVDRLYTLSERGGWVLLVFLFLAWRVFRKRAKIGRRIAHRRAECAFTRNFER